MLACIPKLRLFSVGFPQNGFSIKRERGRETVGSGKQRESRNGKRKPFASKEKNSVASKPLNVQVETEETETCDFYSCSQFCFSLLLFLIGLKEESLEVEVSSNS